MSLETVNMGGPPQITREQMITEGGIPAAIFDYLDKALEDPEILRDAQGISYWYPFAWEIGREIRITEKRSVLFLMEGPGGDTKRGYVRVVDTEAKNAWKKPVFRGPLTLASAKSAVSAIRKIGTEVKASAAIAAQMSLL
jgi:hypothetical protein